MLKAIIRSINATLILAVLLCGVYPLAVTLGGKVLFPQKANGGIILSQEGKAIGATLIGQSFSKPEYFHGRPSSAGSGYDASNSSGSNLGPTHQKLKDVVQGNIAEVLKNNPGLKKGEVPVELVTGSASGLDPHLSPEATLVQVKRVAQARGVDEIKIRALVEQHTERPQWGFFGMPVVNVLLLNLELDRVFPIRPTRPIRS